jgi:hypothetical protein
MGFKGEFRQWEDLLQEAWARPRNFRYLAEDFQVSLLA